MLRLFPLTKLRFDAAMKDGIIKYIHRDYVFNVRYEFSNKFNPELVRARVREETKGFQVLSVFVNEQSVKEYYIVKAVLNAKEKDHAIHKSQILTRFTRLH